MSKPFVGPVFSLAKENPYYRKEIATVTGSQVTLMSIPAKSDVGEEVHIDVDQTLIFVEGTGNAVLEGVESKLEPGMMVVVPKGTR
ncbi:MAG: cupin domain-containing protein, partial [bacterium]|nr:cupin domain-containing protein [bacterium]